MRKKELILAMVFILLFSVTSLAAPQEDRPKQKMIFLPDCDTLDDLEAFVNNGFEMTPGSSCKEPIVIEIYPETKKPPMSFVQRRALGLKNDFNSRPWQFGGVIAKKMRYLKDSAALFKDVNQFEGVELLYRYGATPEYISGLAGQFEEAKAIFDVNASMRFVPESDIGIASADTQAWGGTITVAFYESVAETSLDLEQFRETILYHELGHIYVHKNFGDYIDSPLSFSDIFLFKPFDEYTANLYAYKVLPKEKKESFAEGIRGQMNSLTYIGVRNGFDRADYPTLLQLYAQARKFDVPQLEAYFDLALEYETPELRQKFLELSNEFYERAENLSKENYEETAVSIVEEIKELRKLF